RRQAEEPGRTLLFASENRRRLVPVLPRQSIARPAHRGTVRGEQDGGPRTTQHARGASRARELGPFDVVLPHIGHWPVRIDRVVPPHRTHVHRPRTPGPAVPLAAQATSRPVPASCETAAASTRTFARPRRATCQR